MSYHEASPQQVIQNILRARLQLDKGHNKKAHGGKTAIQTGFAEKCKRCQILRKIK